MKASLLILIVLSGCGLVYAQMAPCTTTGPVPSYLLAQNEVTESNLQKMTYNESYRAGSEDALTKHNINGWLVGGVASGFFLGIVGTAVITIAAGGNVPVYIPEDCDQNGYRAGYYTKTKARNKMAAMTGGLLGTAGIVAIIVVNSQDSSHD